MEQAAGHNPKTVPEKPAVAAACPITSTPAGSHKPAPPWLDFAYLKGQLSPGGVQSEQLSPVEKQEYQRQSKTCEFSAAELRDATGLATVVQRGKLPETFNLAGLADAIKALMFAVNGVASWWQALYSSPR
jgi:hypothetical protein